MTEFLRLVLLLALAGATVTFCVAAGAWFTAEHRRLGRAFRRVLGGAPDALIIAHGTGRAAAFRFDSGRLAVAWDKGAWCLVYGVDELLGGEIIVDGEVVGRVMRGEPRRSLDRRAPSARVVQLTLLFDDPKHPDFDLPLWPTHSERTGAPINSIEAIAEANRWLARAEAVLRRSGAGRAAAVIRPETPPPRPPKPAPPPPVEDDDSEEGEQGELPI